MSNRNRIRKSHEELRKIILKQKSGMKNEMPARVKTDYSVSGYSVKGRNCHVIRPRKNFNGEYMFYIHGGGLCFDMDKSQWNFMLDMIERTKMALVVPEYPLAPEKSCQDVFEMMIPAYRDFSVGNDIQKISIIGEGAGAGIALSLAIQIWKEGYRKPDKMILLSPSLDTEFFDTDLEKKLRVFRSKDELFFSDGIKEFLNQYWVKDYVARTEFTSPIYEDFTDLCGDILVLSGTGDMLNCYARYFYDKAIKNGINAKYFEYEDMPHRFYLDLGLREAEHARKVMTDVLCDSQDAIFNEYMYEIRQRGEWTREFPEIFEDELAVKYLYNNRITSEKSKKQSDYQDLIAVARLHSFDEAVKRFLMQYPDGTVVYLGCSLDTMFDRTDNGRVLWYNCDSPGKIAARRIYVVDREREKTINKSFRDDSWINEVNCNPQQGLLFVCFDFFSYMDQEEVQTFVEKLYRKFPGSQMLFDVAGHTTILATNLYHRRRATEFKKKRFYMNDITRDVAAWNISYHVINVNSILDGIEMSPKWKRMLNLRLIHKHYAQNNKLVHLRLGNEKYNTQILI